MPVAPHVTADVPEEAVVLSLGDARALAALWAVYGGDGRATVRAVAARADRSVSVTFHHLMRLADYGLVLGIGDGTQGALRPAVWLATRGRFEMRAASRLARTSRASGRKRRPASVNS